MPSRLDILREMVAQNPSDNFARYGLAMEYAKTGEWERAAAEYGALLAANPDYAAAYFHGGQVLEKLGRIDEARELYRRGIDVTGRQGNQHARSELQTALDLLG